MECQEAHLHIHESVDNRPLPDDVRAELDTHLAGCRSCRHELEMAQMTKNFLGTQVPVDLPHPTLHAVKAALAAESNRSDAFDSMKGPMGFAGIFRRYPVAAFGAIAVIAALFIIFSPKKNPERMFNESQIAYISADINAYDQLVDGKYRVQLTSDDEQALRNFYQSQGITYNIEIPRFKSASIVGAMVTHAGSVPIAHVVYRKGGHLICLCEFELTNALPANRMAISDSTRQCLDCGGRYWYCDADEKHSVGIWKSKETLCTITSNCKTEELASLFQ